MSRSKTNLNWRIGAHTSIAGALDRAAEEAAALGCNAFQIFSRSPRMWRATALDPRAIDRLKQARETYDLRPLVIHGNYLTNMAAADRVVREKSIEAFRGELERGLAIGADYLVIHPGSYRGQTLSKAMNVLARSIAAASKRLRWNGLQLLLENTAGGGMSIGRDFEELAELRAKVEKAAGLRVGFCIDTAHCYEAGNDLSAPRGLATLLKRIDRTIGLDSVPVIHANDSKTNLGSRLDRHEHIGAGHIGREAFRHLLHHPRLRNKAFILETPAAGGGHQRNVKALKSLARRPPTNGRH